MRAAVWSYSHLSPSQEQTIQVKIPMLPMFAKALAEQLAGLKITSVGVVSSGPMNIVIPEGDSEFTQELNAIIKQLLDEGIGDNLDLKHFRQ